MPYCEKRYSTGEGSVLEKLKKIITKWTAPDCDVGTIWGSPFFCIRRFLITARFYWTCSKVWVFAFSVVRGRKKTERDRKSGNAGAKERQPVSGIVSHWSPSGLDGLRQRRGTAKRYERNQINAAIAGRSQNISFLWFSPSGTHTSQTVTL